MAYKGIFKEALLRTTEALQWVEEQDVEGLRSFFIENSNDPLYCFASGGSFSSIEYASMLYENFQGIAKAMTPLMMDSVLDEVLKRAKILILCGEGKGCDEKYVAKRTASVNPEDCCAVVRNGGTDNYVLKLLGKVSGNCFVYDWPTLSGSFIATIETVCKYGLFYRAFTNEKSILDKLAISLEPNNCFSYAPRVMGDVPPLQEVKNFIVLYNGWSKPVATDFESKMIESDFASVQLCDYRNFCHGRFIFLSKHMKESALVLFLTPKEQQFVKNLFDGILWRDKTDAFPQDTPIIKVETELDSPLASIDLLIKTYVLFGEISQSFNDEPCKPKNPCHIDKRFPKNTPFKDYQH